MRSLSVKLGILYVFLMLINITFFTILIHLNQVDLIIKNKKYETEELASEINSKINTLIDEINNHPGVYPSKKGIEQEIINKCNSIQFEGNYMLFTINGEVLYELNPETFAFKEAYLGEAENAVTRREFSNKPYTASFQNDKEIDIYIPLNIINMDTIILLFRLDISNIHDRLAVIYRIIIIFILFLTFFHVLFGFILHRTIVSPIKILSSKSTDIKNGNYDTRVKLKRTDEFKILSDAFNHMAEAIQDKIENLDKVNKTMKMELQMAGEVQKSIYPTLRKTKHFTAAIYHKPLFEVSGDYHDFFPINDDTYGCIVADVCGHGVSAALITMLIKEKCEEIASKYSDSKDFLQHMYHFFGDLMNKYDKFFTAFYTIIDGKKKSIVFSNAGQSAAYLVRKNKVLRLFSPGILIGFLIEKEVHFESKKVRLIPGDKIIIVTDGIYEAQNSKKEQYGEKRVITLVYKNHHKPCNTILETLIKDFNTFKNNRGQTDDETIIVIEINKTIKRLK